MKYILYIFIFGFCSLSCSNRKNVSSGLIELTFDIEGNAVFRYELIAGSDSHQVKTAQSASLDEFDNLTRIANSRSHILSLDAIKYMELFFKENCRFDETTHDDSIGHYFYYGARIFYVKYMNDTMAEKYKLCIIPSADEGSLYFQKFKTWLEKSPYRDECKAFLRDLEAKFILLGAFPITPEIQELLDNEKRGNG